MIEIRFYDAIDDEKLKFAVIISKKDGKLVFCKHRERSTYEIPGGHREPGENIIDTAKRELYEETGAVDFEIEPVCVYSVTSSDKEETFGMLYYADIAVLENELHNEIEKIIFTETPPEEWTYPLIQPRLLAEAQKMGYC